MTEDKKYPKCAGIYKLTCSITGKIYIGKSVDLNKRMGDYSRYDRQQAGRCYLHNAIIKYKWNSFTVEILEVFKDFDKVSDKDMILDRETFYMELFDSTNKEKGYNICKYSNDRTGIPLTDEHKEKLRKPKSLIHRENIRKARLGVKRPKETVDKMRQSMLGKKHTAEQTEKIRCANLGKIRSEETKLKISKGNLGKKRTEEAKEKVRQAKLGKPLSLETKEKMKVSQQARRNRELSE